MPFLGHGRVGIGAFFEVFFEIDVSHPHIIPHQMHHIAESEFVLHLFLVFLYKLFDMYMPRSVVYAAFVIMGLGFLLSAVNCIRCNAT